MPRCALAARIGKRADVVAQHRHTFDSTNVRTIGARTTKSNLPFIRIVPRDRRFHLNAQFDRVESLLATRAFARSVDADDGRDPSCQVRACVHICASFDSSASTIRRCPALRSRASPRCSRSASSAGHRHPSERLPRSVCTAAPACRARAAAQKSPGEIQTFTGWPPKSNTHILSV